jgi:CheY-like chemotaxis protein
VSGDLGPRKTILITDDDPVHRDLLREVLAPLGFILLSAPDGPSCLALAQHCRPDLFLLDISMQGMDGWTVAETLRATGHHQARILMVSASALEAHGRPLAQPFHDGYLMKPIDIPRLLESIRQLLRIEWQFETDEIVAPNWTPGTGSRPPVQHVEELIGLGQIGYVKAIHVKLDEIGEEYPEHADFVSGAVLRGVSRSQSITALSNRFRRLPVNSVESISVIRYSPASMQVVRSAGWSHSPKFPRSWSMPLYRPKINIFFSMAGSIFPA